ncbi:NADH(P)-binding-domain-containing protein [Mycena pura]|uniref:NADH(P)-binding-domain-containing protein n=1 Tax=Mycena pura TaxID=153505 RepID=A0AAD6V1U1_9AGAR|nr:NADH(P)-binding-domain-containing protein [Mycena pura]
MPKKVVIVGGHGNVSLRLARLLAVAGHHVTSIIRTPAHEADIRAASSAGTVTPLILSLEASPAADFAAAFRRADAGGEERTKAVDYEGALKVFDALELVEEPRPRLILVSAIDVRDPEKVPAHYNENDIALSQRMRAHIAVYMKWKYEADKNLAARTAFRWTILRPGGLTSEPGTGTAAVGRTHMAPQISRDDVATALAYLLDRDDAAGLAIDIVGGDTPIADGLDAAIKKGETDFLG